MNDREKLITGIIERLYGLDEAQLRSVYIFTLQKGRDVESGGAAHAEFITRVRQLLDQCLAQQNLYKTEGCANVF